MRNKTLALHVHEYVMSTMSRVLCHEYYDRSQFGQAVSLPRGRSQVWSRLCCCLLAAVGLRKLCRCLMAAACLRISCVHASLFGAGCVVAFWAAASFGDAVSLPLGRSRFVQAVSLPHGRSLSGAGCVVAMAAACFCAYTPYCLALDSEAIFASRLVDLVLATHTGALQALGWATAGSFAFL